MFTSLNTKEKRERVRQYEHEQLTKNGYNFEQYKRAAIYTHAGEMILKVFFGTAASAEIYTRYRTPETFAAAIEQVKKNQDAREEYKKKQKEAGGYKSSAASCAEAIRAELKAKFPGYKFTVRSSNFAGGNSVDISWTDGVTVGEVEAITNKYQYGSFNGMEDIYEYTNTREDIPQAKWVGTHREISKDLVSSIAEQMRGFMEFNENDYRNSSEQCARLLVCDTSIPLEYQKAEVYRNEKTAAVTLDQFFGLRFIGAKSPEPTPKKAAKVEQPQAGKVQIVEHPKRSHKILVIGETYAIKEALKNAGGWWNKWEKGWEFRASDAEKVADVIRAAKQAQQPTETAEPTEEAQAVEVAAEIVQDEATEAEHLNALTY